MVHNSTVQKILVFSFSIFLILSSFGLCLADNCIVTPKSMTMDYTGIPTTNESITFTVEGESDCDSTLYYYFSYIGGYGTTAYATNSWENMRDVVWSSDNSVTYSFSEAGSYVVVAWVSPTQSTPNPVPLIGTTVTIVDGGSESDCIFDASALDITVSDAITGAAISGATITASGQTATTGSSGTTTLTHLPTNTEITVTVTASGYSSQTSQVFMECGESQSQGFALLSDSAGLQGDIKVILTWGENPRDLDSHITGPMTDGDDRFHVYYSNKNNCSSAPCDSTVPAWLDVDDTSSYGPETVSIQKRSDGTFMAGTYKYYVHHYSGTSDIPSSGAMVKIYKGGTEIRSFSPPSTTAAVTDDWVWSVFSMDVTASGSVSITPVNTYSGTHYSNDTTIFRSLLEEAELPEEYHLFLDMPEKY